MAQTTLYPDATMSAKQVCIQERRRIEDQYVQGLRRLAAFRVPNSQSELGCVAASSNPTMTWPAEALLTIKQCLSSPVE